MKRILAFSSSREGNSGFLETALPVIHAFLGPDPLKIAFIPFAAVGKEDAEYLSMVRNAFTGYPYSIELVTPKNGEQLIGEADVIMTGGGNTFKLLHDIYEYGLFDLIRQKVNAGIPYIGWSAGSNITGATIGTTNDMPIIQPASFNAFGFFNFQLNPHYFNKPIEGFNGETRDQRLFEYMKMNPGRSIVALPEGTALKLENDSLKFIGAHAGTIFYPGEKQQLATKTIDPGEDISYLLTS